MQAIENLLWGGVFMAIEDREDIIFLCVVGLAVFLDNPHGVRDELKGQQFLRFMAGVVNPAVHNIAVAQGCYIRKINACRVVGEQKDVPCKLGIVRSIIRGYLQCNEFLYILFRDGSLPRPCP